MIGIFQLNRLVGNKIGYKMLDDGNNKIINNKKESEYNCRVVTTIIILTPFILITRIGHLILAIYE